MREEKVIMYDSPEAATFGTLQIEGKVPIPVWISSNGRAFSKEDMARYDSHTHKTCECGKPMSKGWTRCTYCIAKNRSAKYLEMPFKEWDGDGMVCDYDGDEYFSTSDDFLEWCDNNEIQPETVRLVICEPNYLKPIDPEDLSEDLPEDGELPDEVTTALNALNEVIKKQKPISYSPGKVRTTIEDTEK